MHPSNRSSNILTLDCLVIGSELVGRVSSCLGPINTQTILDNFENSLNEIIEHCLDKIERNDTEFTSSDFRQAYDPVMIINPDKKGPPLIIFPPGEYGSEVYLRTLCPLLPETQKIVLLDNYLFKQNKESEFKTYREIALKYIEILFEHDVIRNMSNATCYLSGWSMGGIIAYEVMLELEKLKIKVLDNFLMDPIVPSLLKDNFDEYVVPYYSKGYFPEKTSNKITIYRCTKADKTLPLTTLSVNVPYLGFDSLTNSIEEYIIDCTHTAILTDPKSLHLITQNMTEKELHILRD